MLVTHGMTGVRLHLQRCPDYRVEGVQRRVGSPLRSYYRQVGDGTGGPDR